MTNKTKVFFRVDGNKEIGLGHIFRSLALADMLKKQFDCFFLVREPLESLKIEIEKIANLISLPIGTSLDAEAAKIAEMRLIENSIFVLDGYNFGVEYQKILKKASIKLVCIDDIHTDDFVADAIINHNPLIRAEDYSCIEETKIYIGFDYLLLRKVFLDQITIPKLPCIEKEIFINLGGADKYKLYQKITEAAIEANYFNKIHLVLGQAFQKNEEFVRWFDKHQSIVEVHFELTGSELVALFKRCSLAICPSSTICIEAICVGINLIVGSYADNQEKFANYLSQNEMAYNLGDFRYLDTPEIIDAILDVVEKDYWKQQKKKVVKSSARSLQNIFINLENDRIN